MRWLVLVAVLGCRGSVEEETHSSPPVNQASPAAVAPAPIAAKVTTYGCDPATPKAACDAFAAQVGALVDHADVVLSPCVTGSRIGEWSYALVVPQFAPTEALTADDVRQLWQGDSLQISAETLAALTPLLGATKAEAISGRPDVGKHWAIVPAHELLPAWKVVTIDGKHPLADAATNPLSVGLCASAKARVANVDPAHLTVIAMTGTTAMTRYMGPLLDKKGTTYPAKDVASWFSGADFVHVSNEVSFVPDCVQGKPTMEFCSRESYIELLEAIHANIIELTGSHLSDYGYKWIDHTLDMYREHGMRWFGGGHDQVDGTRPLVLDHHGNRIALVGCNMVRTTSHEIRDTAPDTAACDMRRLDWQVRDLRAHGLLPIVSIQHEEVYVHDPPDVIVSDFRHLAEVGAAFVFGSQAHCAHPWEVVDGAYLHYGAGNFFFDQEGTNTRDGTVDRLFIYDNKLLTVGHLYTRLEENGRPRPLADIERTEFLHVMSATLGKLRRADPWGEPKLLPPARQHADSFVLHSVVTPALVYAPVDADGSLLPGGGAKPDATVKFALVIATRPRTVEDGVAFVVSPPAGTWSGPTLAAAKQFALAKYPIDPARVTIESDGR